MIWKDVIEELSTNQEGEMIKEEEEFGEETSGSDNFRWAVNRKGGKEDGLEATEEERRLKELHHIWEERDQ